MESHKRSITKALTFRVIATLTTMLLVFFLTSSWALVGIIGGVDLVSKLFLYYFHERVWNNISWGRRKAK